MTAEAFHEYGQWVCPNRSTSPGPRGHEVVHRVKWNSGNPWCLTCDVPAVWLAHSGGPT